jgi:hypothetical protein
VEYAGKVLKTWLWKAVWPFVFKYRNGRSEEWLLQIKRLLII